jgi:hypothetical protein
MIRILPIMFFVVFAFFVFLSESYEILNGMLVGSLFWIFSCIINIRINNIQHKNCK